MIEKNNAIILQLDKELNLSKLSPGEINKVHQKIEALEQELAKINQ